ncbi:MAG: DUF6567 family protein [Flammeovirgaceae bacterium]
MKQLTWLLFIIICASCTSHIGSISGGSAAITSNNFSAVRFAFGSASTAHFLGIGGNQKDALVLEAKRNLYLNCNLKPGQAIGQTTIDFKKTLIFPFSTTKVTVSAEIIDFSDSTKIESNLKEFTHGKTSPKFELGEHVIYVRNHNNKRYSTHAQVLDFDRGRYVIKFFDLNNQLKIKHVYESKLLKDESIAIPIER